MKTLKLFLALFTLCFVSVTLAQVDCPSMVTAVLDVVNAACDQISRNEVCYGNINLIATPRAGVSDFHFEQTGDVAHLADINTLQLSSFSATDETWGMALMRIQANLPQTLPGQNIAFVLFGDVSMTNEGDEIVELPVTATAGVNVRLRPTTNASVIASLGVQQEVTATGRLADSSWIRVRLDDSSIGWVSADFLQGALDHLLAIDPGAPVFGPMQAFYFTSGIGDAPCAEVPDSGILIQTPEGASMIELRANNVEIQLGSTIYLQAIAGNAMFVYVLEGHATLTVDGVSQIVPAGTFSTIPLDENGFAEDTPEYPEPYTESPMLSLPIVLLPEAISIASPLAGDQIASAIDALTPTIISIPDTPGGVINNGTTVVNGLPPSGRWSDTNHVLANTCDPDTIPVGSSSTAYPQLTFSEDRSSMLFDFGSGYASFTFYRHRIMFMYLPIMMVA